YVGADRTAVRLLSIRASDRSRQVLVDGRNRTKPLLSLNQAACWDRAASLLQCHLPPVRPSHDVPVAPKESARPRTEDTLPRRLATYPFRLIGRGIRLGLMHARGQRRWSVALFRRDDESSHGFGEPAQVEAAPAGMFHADPILYRDPGSG